MSFTPISAHATVSYANDSHNSPRPSASASSHQTAHVTRQNTHLKEQLDRAHSQISQLRKAKRALGKEIDMLKGQLTAVETKHLSQNIRNRKKNRELLLANRNKADQIARLQRLKAEGKYRSKDSSDKHSATGDTDSNFSEMSEISQLLVFLDAPEDEEVAEELKAVYGPLRNDISVSLNALTEATEAEENYEAVALLLDSSFDTISLLITENKAQHRIIAELTTRFQSNQLKLNESKLKTEAKSEETIQKLEEQLSIFTADKTNDTRRIQTLEGKLTSLTGEKEKKSEEIKNRDMELESLRTQMTSMKETIQSISNDSTQSDRLHDSITELRTEVQTLERDKQSLNHEMEFKNTQMETKVSELETMQCVHESMMEQLKLVQQHNHSLHDELKAVRQSMNRMSRQRRTERLRKNVVDDGGWFSCMCCSSGKKKEPIDMDSPSPEEDPYDE